MPTLLRLEVTEYPDGTRWRWALKDENGTSLADHEVRLDRSAEQFDAFTDLQDYVSWHAAPDKRLAEEARTVTWLGDWIGTEVFGPAIGDALLQHSPAIVEVILPPGAESLAYRPWKPPASRAVPSPVTTRRSSSAQPPRATLSPRRQRRPTACEYSACSASPRAAPPSTCAASASPSSP